MALFKCGACRHEYNNPLGHVCTKRKKAPPKKKPKRPEHDYHSCYNPDCRLTHVRYREGYDNGFEDGMNASQQNFEAGYAAGVAAAAGEG